MTQARVVAVEHPDVGQQVVGQADRLRPLGVGAAPGAGCRRAPRPGAGAPRPGRAAAARWPATCSRTYIRVSVMTWSLRLRAVCRRRPASPASSVRRRSTAVWMSSSDGGEREVAGRQLLLDLVQAEHDGLASSRGTIPQAPSMRAWAREAATSWGQRRRSTGREAFRRSNASAGPPAKRPPQSRAPALTRRGRRARGPLGGDGLAERRAHPLHLVLGHLGEEGQGDGRGADGLGHRQLAGAVAVRLAVVRLEVDAGQVRLGRDPPGLQGADHRVPVEVRVEPRRVDEPRAPLRALVHRGHARRGPAVRSWYQPATRARPASMSSRRSSWATPIAQCTSDSR